MPGMVSGTQDIPTVVLPEAGGTQYGKEPTPATWPYTSRQVPTEAREQIPGLRVSCTHTLSGPPRTTDGAAQRPGSDADVATVPLRSTE